MNLTYRLWWLWIGFVLMIQIGSSLLFKIPVPPSFFAVLALFSLPFIGKGVSEARDFVSGGRASFRKIPVATVLKSSAVATAFLGWIFFSLGPTVTAALIYAFTVIAFRKPVSGAFFLGIVFFAACPLGVFFGRFDAVAYCAVSAYAFLLLGIAASVSVSVTRKVHG